MNKDIKKNREALIRHFIYHGNGDYIGCAKEVVVKYLKSSVTDYVCSFQPVPKEVLSHLEMSPDQWHRMERYFENWVGPIGQGKRLEGGESRSYSDVAGWLQTLPGWPRVL